MPRKTNKQREKAPKSKVLNVKVIEEDFNKINEIALQTGATVSSMLRVIINNQLNKVDKTGDPSAFLHSK